jgi:hypothetical protein
MIIGSSPIDEDCAQVGSPDYSRKSRIELRAFINQLKRAFPELNNEDCPVRLSIKSFPHDFGTYHEVVANYNDDNEAGLELACKLEGNTPENWDEQAKEEIAEALQAVSQ